jgi:hypothetical protein
MKHLSCKYRRRRTPQEQREFREAQRRRVVARWEKTHREQRPREPDRVLLRIRIERPGETMQIVEQILEDLGEGRSRIRIDVDGETVTGMRSLAGAIRAIAIQQAFRSGKGWA